MYQVSSHRPVAGLHAQLYKGGKELPDGLPGFHQIQNPAGKLFVDLHGIKDERGPDPGTALTSGRPDVKKDRASLPWQVHG